jgi:amidohydrolase
VPDHSSEQASALAAIDEASSSLRALSLSIHGQPELGYEEHHAHQVLTDYLEGAGFEVVRSAYGLPTAFRAVAGSGGPSVAVLCEYDALPAIGHACGHNLIAAAGVAVALGLRAGLEGREGTVVVLGSPAEERGGGGKIRLIQAGAFEDLDAAVMLHPGMADRAAGQALAHRVLSVEFHGRASHAAGAPWLGLNALDAMILAFSALGLLRQQLQPSYRVHGVITHGGDSPNIIPERTAALLQVRAPTSKEVEPLRGRVLACFEGAATQTGCRLEHSWSDLPYEDLVQNPVLAGAYTRHFESAGGKILPPNVGGSTDMGNVSHVLPALHPHFRIPTPEGQGNHTRGFAEAAGTPEAHEAAMRAAGALALAALEVYLDGGVRQAMRKAFEDASR